jgi:hypothetical protein
MEKEGNRRVGTEVHMQNESSLRRVAGSTTWNGNRVEIKIGAQYHTRVG